MKNFYIDSEEMSRKKGAHPEDEPLLKNCQRQFMLILQFLL